MMDFDATSLYPSAMWDENSVHPKTDTGLVLKPRMKIIYAEAFSNHTFNHDGIEFAILKKK